MALEAHLAETDRRIQDASKLGTSLVQQRKELSQQLKEVEEKQDDGEIGPELRQKLADFEEEYRQVVKDSARAFIGPRAQAQAHHFDDNIDSQVSVSFGFLARREFTAK